MKLRDFCLLASVLFLIGSIFFIPRIGQAENYHLFADQRTLLGIPHFFDVISNLPFLIAGLLGLASYHKFKIVGFARVSFFIFLVGLVLTCFGSGYYHWQPTTERLFWDRLPMTFAFMGFLCSLIGLRISQVLGKYLLVPLLFLGVASVVYWAQTQANGAGDLRPYLVVQFGMLLLTALILLFYPGAALSNKSVWLLFGFYVAAKVTETFDHQIYHLLFQQVSGHTLKHILAGAGAWIFVKQQS